MNRQARKYVLIPEDRYKRMIALINNKETSTLKNINDSSLDDKQTEGTENKSVISYRIDDDKNNELENESKQKTLEEILSYFPSRMKSRARLIGSYFDKDNTKLTYNSLGELLYNGNAIKGSSLTDLLYDACCPRRKYEPIGADYFYNELKQNNLPKGIIRNKDRHKYLNETPIDKKGETLMQHKWKKYK